MTTSSSSTVRTASSTLRSLSACAAHPTAGELCTLILDSPRPALLYTKFPRCLRTNKRRQLCLRCMHWEGVPERCSAHSMLNMGA